MWVSVFCTPAWWDSSYCSMHAVGVSTRAMQCATKALMCALPVHHRVEKGVLTVWIRKAEGARPNIKDVFID